MPKSKNYPEQTGEYKVKVKSNQTNDKWSDYDDARCQISVGQDYHEGSKLSSMLNWCAHRFSNVMVCVNDTLQRYNLMFERKLREEDAIDLALEKGDDWIERNKPIYDEHDNMSIVRWDDWLKDDYTDVRPKVDFMYASNPEFQQAINSNIMEIWSRRQEARPDLYTKDNFPRFFELSKNYLLEEISAFSVMFETKEAIDIYPGTTIFAATVFQGKDVEGAPSGLGKGHFSRIDFSKNKNYQPEEDDNDQRFG